MAVTNTGTSNLTQGAVVDQRLQNQIDRANAGVADGQLTQAQAQALIANDTMVAQQEAGMIALNGGLTGADRVSLRQELDANSAQIWSQRHATPQPQPVPSSTTPVSGGTPTGLGYLVSNTTGSPMTLPNGQTLPPNAIMLNDGTVIQPGSNGDGQGIEITTPDGQSSYFTGDPHAQTAAGNFDVQGTANGQGFQIVEAGGNVINVTTSAPDQNGATYITGVMATGPGGRQASITGLDGSTPQTSGVTTLTPGSSDYQAARALNPNETLLTNAGSINGQALGANFVTMEPGANGQMTPGEITGGSNLTGYTFDPGQVTLENLTVVNKLAALWNSIQQAGGASTGTPA